MSLKPNETFPEWTRTLSTIAWAYSFWATLLYEMLKVKITKALPTLAVGGGNLYVNRDYFVDPKFDDDNRVFMVAHELSHEMLFHPHLMQEYAQTGIDGEPLDTMRMNMAMDYCINDMLVKWNVGKLHPDWLIHEQFTYEDSILDVYRRLKPPPQPGGGSGQQGEPQPGQGGGGGDSQAKGPPQKPQPGEGDQDGQGGSSAGHGGDQPLQYDILDKEGNTVDKTPAQYKPQDDHNFDEPSPHSEQDWKQAVVGAYEAAKQIGHGSTDLERFVEDYITPKRDWRKELRDHLTARRGRDTFNWQRPHKRKMRERGIPIPTRYSFKLGDICMVHDVSGSVSQREHMALKGCGVEILNDLPPKSLRVLCVTDEITDDKEYSNAMDYMDWQPKGCGGTDMEEGFRYLLGQHYFPDLCIVLTDGYTETNNRPPFPVVWISTCAEPETFGYGHVIKMDLSEE